MSVQTTIASNFAADAMVFPDALGQPKGVSKLSEANIRDLVSPARSADMSSMPTIGEFVRRARTEKGYNQKELADLVGVSTAQWCRIEGDVNRPSRDTLRKTSAYLGVPFHELVALAGYSALKTDNSLYNKQGEKIDTDGIINSIFTTDSDLLDCLSNFEEIGSKENVLVLTLLLRVMRKEVMTANTENGNDSFFLSSFQALKQFIISSYSGEV